MMSTEPVLQFKSSANVLEICILIKDVITRLTLDQYIFPKFQEIIRELLSLDRALLQIGISSEADFSLTLKDKAASIIEHGRYYLIAFLEKFELDTTSACGGSAYFLARTDENNMEDFRSTIKELSTNLNTLLALESRPCLLNASSSSTKGPDLEDSWNSLPSASSRDWEGMDEPEYVHLAQIHHDDFAFGSVHYPEIVTYDHNPNQDASEDTFLLESSDLEDTSASPPPTPLLDAEEDDMLTLTTNNQYFKTPRIRRRMPSLHAGVRRGLKHSARDHPLYSEVTTGLDGLYHCPWEGKDPLCNHKPHKNKCIYSKFIDAHLKPYRCEVKTCENMCFASAAILFRHEREAHKMHGVGESLYLCPAQDCARGVASRGFPRHWNLVDHMKRVHNCSPKKHNSDPRLGCTIECKCGSPKTSRKRKVPATSPLFKKAPIQPPIDPAVVESQVKLRQLRSESPQSVTSPLSTESHAESMNDAPAQSPVNQSTVESIEHFPLSYDNIAKFSIQTNLDSTVLVGRPDESIPANEDLPITPVLESPPEAVVPVEIQILEDKMTQSIAKPPQSNVREGDSPVKKPPRCTRSKNGCLTCRKRKIKCDEVKTVCGGCNKGNRECKWPNPNLVVCYSEAGVEHRNVLSQKPAFPYPVPLPTSQSQPRPELKSFGNSAQNLPQSNENKAMDEGDARLLHLLQSSIQAN